MSSIKHTANFTIAKPIDILFPLFSAEGEKLWVPGWDYENIMGSTDLHEDYIFLTKTHSHAVNDAIWLVKRYEPKNFFVQFYKVEPDEKVGIITVQCTAKEKNMTRVDVTYEYVGLGTKGNAFIKGFSLADYEEFIGEWHKLLLAYFESN